MAVLEARDIHKSYPGVHALRGVSFDLEPGEVHALVGENGAGKSTLIRVLSGSERPDAGTIAFLGQTVAHLDPREARRLGIATIHQQPALFRDLTVAENIGLALEPPRLWSRVDWRARRQTAAALLGEVGVPIDPDRLASTLSMPEQQIVEIAKALGLNARVLIMDEPSAALSAREVSRLIEIVRRLCGRGTAVVYISHRLDEVYTLADRITVLRDGRSMATRGTAALSRTELVALMVGRDMEPAAPVRATTRGDVVLDVRDLSSGVHVGPVSFSVHRGEIVGLAGLVGSGRTELAETLFNVRPKDAGRVSVDGALVGGRDPSSAVQARLAYVPEDRRHHGVIGGMTIAANTTLASLARVSRAGVVDRSAERALTTEYMRRLGTKATSPDVAVETLSGGNQQKVAVARWLATDPAVLILDEPTQGVDVGAKAEIHAMIRDLAARGLGVLVISSDLPEVLSLSDRVLVMRNGRIAGELDRDTATPERVMDFALHGGAGARSSEASA